MALPRIARQPLFAGARANIPLLVSRLPHRFLTMSRIPLADAPDVRERRDLVAWHALRITVAGLIAAHGWARFIAGAVPPFGAFLTSQGFPMGLELAIAVTALEIVGSAVFAAGRFVAPLAVVFALVYFAGIVLVHAKAGWFVVGLGRNGAEYSVLLIVCLLCIAWHARSRTTRAGSDATAQR